MLFLCETSLGQRDWTSVSLHSECTGKPATQLPLAQRAAVIIEETMVTLRFTFVPGQSNLTRKVTETSLSNVDDVHIAHTRVFGVGKNVSCFNKGGKVVKDDNDGVIKGYNNIGSTFCKETAKVARNKW